MTNYQRVFSAISEEIDDLKYDIHAIQYSHMLQSARGIHLDKIGNLVKYPRPYKLNDYQYRQLLERAMILNVGAGTLVAIREFIIGYLGTDKISIREPHVGMVTVGIDKTFQPREAEIRDELRQLVACGIKIDIIFTNTYWNEVYWNDDLGEYGLTPAHWV